MSAKPRLAVYKFASCDGCQLAFLNAGADLLTLAKLVDIINFAEAGPMAPYADVDITFVEGSISTPQDLEAIQHVRAHTRFLITFGACATAGGPQALRNLADAGVWMQEIYASPEYIATLKDSTAIAQHVKVDLELWGCPPTTRQVLLAVRSLLFGVEPLDERSKVCLECKRQQNVCVLVAKGEPCMGPVTRTGCGALCPSFGRDCYGCFGPAENPEADILARRFQGLGLLPEEIARRFWFINSGAREFNEAGKRWDKKT